MAKVAGRGFSFKQFTVMQDMCAMKVGTDGCLLGAWAQTPAVVAGTPVRILDIGTGTGLISLMLAQRFPDAEVTALDIDEAAVRQAEINIAASPFAARVTAVQGAVQNYSGIFNMIVSNPPFFVDALECPDDRRTMARHTSTLSYHELMHAAYRMLDADGELSVIIPFDYRQRLESEAAIVGFHLHRSCQVFTSAKRPPKRFLLSFTKKQLPVVTGSLLIGSEEFRTLLKDFYLHF